MTVEELVKLAAELHVTDEHPDPYVDGLGSVAK